MKRKILFRGKCLDTKEWVYGCYELELDGKHTVDGYQVNEDTIGQYIGLNDWEETEIFEGDIVLTGAGDYGVVTYKFCCYIIDVDNHYKYPIRKMDVRVVGNIYDNPELKEDELNG